MGEGKRERERKRESEGAVVGPTWTDSPNVGKGKQIVLEHYFVLLNLSIIRNWSKAVFG